MGEEYMFERLTDQNLHDLQILIKDLYGREEPIENLIRKYDTSTWGVQYIGYIAYSKNREVAAYYGVFPVMLEIHGENILAAQSGDTMTHRHHQRKGLFIQLAYMTYELAKEVGIQFIFGFPNDNSFPGFQKKLNWKFSERMNNYNFLVPTF
jgi:hypothetical protein